MATDYIQQLLHASTRALYGNEVVTAGDVTLSKIKDNGQVKRKKLKDKEKFRQTENLSSKVDISDSNIEESVVKRGSLLEGKIKNKKSKENKAPNISAFNSRDFTVTKVRKKSKKVDAVDSNIQDSLASSVASVDRDVSFSASKKCKENELTENADTISSTAKPTDHELRRKSKKSKKKAKEGANHDILDLIAASMVALYGDTGAKVKLKNCEDGLGRNKKQSFENVDAPLNTSKKSKIFKGNNVPIQDLHEKTVSDSLYNKNRHKKKKSKKNKENFCGSFSPINNQDCDQVLTSSSQKKIKRTPKHKQIRENLVSSCRNKENRRVSKDDRELINNEVFIPESMSMKEETILPDSNDETNDLDYDQLVGEDPLDFNSSYDSLILEGNDEVPGSRSNSITDKGDVLSQCQVEIMDGESQTALDSNRRSHFVNNEPQCGSSISANVEVEPQSEGNCHLSIEESSTKYSNPCSTDLSPLSRRSGPVSEKGNNLSKLSNPLSRSCSPQSRNSSPQSRNSSPHSRNSSPQSRNSSPQSRSCSPQSRRCSPQSRSGSPQSRLCSPQSRNSSPQSRRCSSLSRNSSPQSRNCSPASRSCNPNPTFESCSPASRRCSPQSRRCSPLSRNSSPQSRNSSPQSRSCSPASRSCNPSPTFESCSPASKSRSCCPASRSRSSSPAARSRSCSRSPAPRSQICSPRWKQVKLKPWSEEEETKYGKGQKKLLRNQDQRVQRNHDKAEGLEKEGFTVCDLWNPSSEISHPYPASKSRIRSPASQSRSPSPASRNRGCSPASRNRGCSPASRSRSCSSASRNRGCSPASISRSCSPASRNRSCSPASISHIRSPASISHIRSPASINRIRSTASRNRSPSPASRKRSCSPVSKCRSPASRSRSPSSRSRSFNPASRSQSRSPTSSNNPTSGSHSPHSSRGSPFSRNRNPLPCSRSLDPLSKVTQSDRTNSQVRSPISKRISNRERRKSLTNLPPYLVRDPEPNCSPLPKTEPLSGVKSLQPGSIRSRSYSSLNLPADEFSPYDLSAPEPVTTTVDQHLVKPSKATSFSYNAAVRRRRRSNILRYDLFCKDIIDTPQKNDFTERILPNEWKRDPLDDSPTFSAKRKLSMGTDDPDSDNEESPAKLPCLEESGNEMGSSLEAGEAKSEEGPPKVDKSGLNSGKKNHAMASEQRRKKKRLLSMKTSVWMSDCDEPNVIPSIPTFNDAHKDTSKTTVAKSFKKKKSMVGVSREIHKKNPTFKLSAPSSSKNQTLVGDLYTQVNLDPASQMSKICKYILKREVPVGPLNSMYTRAYRPSTAEERATMLKYCPNLKFGKFLDHEDTVIMKGYQELVDQDLVTDKDKLLIEFAKIEKDKINARNIVGLFVGQGILENRLAYDICNRLFVLLSGDPYFSQPFRKGQVRRSVKLEAYKKPQRKTNPTRVKWTCDDDKQLLQHIMDATNTKAVEDMNAEKIDWGCISEKIGRPLKLVRSHWLRILKPMLVLAKQGMTDDVDFKIKLFEAILESDVKTRKEIDWIALEQQFLPRPSAALQNVYNSCVYKIRLPSHNEILQHVIKNLRRQKVDEDRRRRCNMVTEKEKHVKQIQDHYLALIEQ